MSRHGAHEPNPTTSSKQPSLWWESLNEECPITLEPLSALPYPPFTLSHHYFDGVALASYIVSRGIFQNPLTREPLTYQDCKRLDEYVHSYHSDDLAVCCEAFGLRQSVRVVSNDNDSGRAQVLRSEAAAALCHLFVYGRQRRESRLPRARSTTVVVPPPRAGFSLYEPPTYSTPAVEEMDGLRIIDDDEARVVQSERQDWNQVQQAFPPLSTAAAGSVPSVSPDQHLLNTVKETAVLSQQEEEARMRLLQEGQRHVIEEARRRQEARRQAREAARTARRDEYEQERQEEEELERARLEIEQWRNRHWDQLLQESALTQQAQVVTLEKSPPAAKEAAAEESPKDKNEEAPTPEMQAAMKAEKAAAKRRRAKERKKLKKAEEQKEAKKREEIERIEKEKEASINKCAACGGGILGCGFEKFDRRFCSTKCARSGPLNAKIQSS